jgi:hypothetical protein
MELMVGVGIFSLGSDEGLDRKYLVGSFLLSLKIDLGESAT